MGRTAPFSQTRPHLQLSICIFLPSVKQALKKPRRTRLFHYSRTTSLNLLPISLPSSLVINVYLAYSKVNWSLSAAAAQKCPMPYTNLPVFPSPYLRYYSYVLCIRTACCCAATAMAAAAPAAAAAPVAAAAAAAAAAAPSHRLQLDCAPFPR